MSVDRILRELREVEDSLDRAEFGFWIEIPYTVFKYKGKEFEYFLLIKQSVSYDDLVAVAREAFKWIKPLIDGSVISRGVFGDYFDVRHNAVRITLVGGTAVEIKPSPSIIMVSDKIIASEPSKYLAVYTPVSIGFFVHGGECRAVYGADSIAKAWFEVALRRALNNNVRVVSNESYWKPDFVTFNEDERFIVDLDKNT